MNEPNQRARDLLQRYRGAIGPSDAQRDALVRSVMTRIDGVVPPPGGGAPSSGAPWLTIVGVAVLVGGGLLLGTRDAAQRDASDPPAIAPTAIVEPSVDVHAPAVAAVAPAIVATPSRTAAPVVAPPVEPPKSARRARAKLDASRDPALRESPAPMLVDEEVRLLREANLALRRSDVLEARARFDEHAQRFPDGSLVELREVGRALLRCRDDASAIDDFARRFPGSPHIARLRNECAR
ncbi:MAG TPA: hypothetical protein VG755_30580 [Nannocystaceae bacterium]|nr:hypothetical protein [Nannocystaceae bacterium]